MGRRCRWGKAPREPGAARRWRPPLSSLHRTNVLGRSPWARKRCRSHGSETLGNPVRRHRHTCRLRPRRARSPGASRPAAGVGPSVPSAPPGSRAAGSPPRAPDAAQPRGRGRGRDAQDSCPRGEFRRGGRGGPPHAVPFIGSRYGERAQELSAPGGGEPCPHVPPTRSSADPDARAPPSLPGSPNLTPRRRPPESPLPLRRPRPPRPQPLPGLPSALLPTHRLPALLPLTLPTRPTPDSAAPTLSARSPSPLRPVVLGAHVPFQSARGFPACTLISSTRRVRWPIRVPRSSFSRLPECARTSVTNEAIPATGTGWLPKSLCAASAAAPVPPAARVRSLLGNEVSRGPDHCKEDGSGTTTPSRHRNSPSAEFPRRLVGGKLSRCVFFLCSFKACIFPMVFH